MQAAIRNDDMPITWAGLSIDERNPEDDASELMKLVLTELKTLKLRYEYSVSHSVEDLKIGKLAIDILDYEKGLFCVWMKLDSTILLLEDCPFEVLIDFLMYYPHKRK